MADLKKTDNQTGLDLLRAPFPENAISKLPKPTKKQTDEVRNDFKKGIRCDACGGWHHPKVVHLDYVGHAALTDRLLDCDPQWNWEPLAFTESGNPALDENGGMWIKLTVCGVTRYGYGHPDGKRGGDAIKEVIGDALRNAAMRFGAALDLWHKGQLHVDADQGSDDDPPKFNADAAAKRIMSKLNGANSIDDLAARWKDELQAIADVKSSNSSLYDEVCRTKEARKTTIITAQNRAAADLGGDDIPY
ncbi:MAG: hypothetical protein EP341_09655 [Sphingomonadales bacterium]|nr:MAG: hypothetical protein EP341_09655 [Sphingomonadales bacterium]